MSDPNRIRRQQILREAEGYLDLITVFGDRMPCRPDARDELARRVLATLDRIENPGGMKGHILFLRGQAQRAIGEYVQAVPLFREAAEIEPMLGIPAGRLPRSETRLREYLEAMLASGAIEVTDTARRLSRQILTPPMPGALKPAFWLANLPAVGLLPPEIRAAYGLPWSGRRMRALRVLAAVSRLALPLTPGVLRYWADARRAERRLRGP